jgi:hypothetical protein
MVRNYLSDIGIVVHEKQEAGNALCTCPWCGDEKGLRVALAGEKAGLANCFKCGESGNAWTLAQKLRPDWTKAQVVEQQGRALDLLSEKLTPTRRKLIERHLTISEKLTDVVCRPEMPCEPVSRGLSRDQADHIADRNECGPTQGCDEVQCRGSMPPGVVIDEAAGSSIPQQ